MANENFDQEFYEKKIAALLLMVEDERKMADLHMASVLEANSLLAELLELIEEYSDFPRLEKNWPALRQKILIFVVRANSFRPNL